MLQRSLTRFAGNYSRVTTVAQSQKQQQQQQQHSSQPRSSSVLASLLRIRAQFQRLRISEQQQVVATVLARTKGVRLYGAKGSSPAAATSSTDDSLSSSSGADDVAEAAESPAASTSTSSTSSLQAGILLCTEAQRLLNGVARGKDALSDVAVTSPLYANEAGKLLTTAASFGAATTSPRVQEVCAWVRDNVDSLDTTRRVMSLCTPLMNLADGSTKGVGFVLEVLYEPLVLALQDVSCGDAETAAEAVSLRGPDGTSSDSVAVEQQLVALASVFGMIAKWSTTASERAAQLEDGTSCPPSAGDDGRLSWKEERDKMLMLAVTAVAALARFTQAGGSSGGRSRDEQYAVLRQISVQQAALWLQSLHGLERVYSTHATEAERAAATQRLLLCYRAVLPMVQRTLESATGDVAAADGVAAASTAASASSSSGAAPTLRVQEVVELVQLGLFASVEQRHTDVLLHHGLLALPRALSAASARELCVAAQTVSRVRQQRPAALSAARLNAIVAALRPRLFLLRESQAYQLRPVDCSVLLTHFSRWEEVPGVTISADLVELLSQRFAEQLPTVAAAQLVPFVQALARMEERHRRDRGATGAGEAAARTAPSPATPAADEMGEAATGSGHRTALARLRRQRRERAVRFAYGSTARVAAQCAQRVGVLVASDDATRASPSSASPQSPVPPGSVPPPVVASQLSATEAANLVSAFAQLSSPQVEYVFAKVEPLLAASLRTDCAAPATTAPSTELFTRTVVYEAVTRFIARVSAAQYDSAWSAERSATLRRAEALLAAAKADMTHVVAQAARPKELVMLWGLLRDQFSHTTAGAEDGDDEGVAGEAAAEKDARQPTATISPRTRTPKRSGEARLARCFARQVAVVAPACNGFELGALANAVRQLSSAELLSASTARGAMLALWACCTSGLESANSLEGGAEGVSAATHASSTPMRLTLDDCKRLLDASRATARYLSPKDLAALPPLAYLNTCAALCTAALTRAQAREASAATPGDGSGVSRGTPDAFRQRLVELQRHCAFGRSLLSLYALLPPQTSGSDGAADGSAARQEAWSSLAEAHLAVLRVAIESVAAEAALCESWPAKPGAARPRDAVFPQAFSVLSITAHVATQLPRLASSQSRSSRAEETVEREEVEGGSGGGESSAVAEDEGYGLGAAAGETQEMDTQAAVRAKVEATVAALLASLGDAVALLAKHHRHQAPALADEAADEGDAAATSTETLAPSNTVIEPKHLLMLLQAFETAHYRHPEMLYSILPELRGCAAVLQPLELSLLIRALAQLGAWNSRLLRVLASAVEAKVQSCELRHCHSLLRGLIRAGSVSPDTFVELRGAHYEDWARAGSRRGDAPQEPLQRLVESVLWRLDALVRTRAAFFALAKTANTHDLVSVVSALRFFHVPPPATYDAFVVLAIRKLRRSHSVMPPTAVVRESVALLGAVAELRQPAHRRVSAHAVWAVLQRSLTPSRLPSRHRIDVPSLPLERAWQLWRNAGLHSLQFGGSVARIVTGGGDDVGASAALLPRLDRRLRAAMAAYARGPHPDAQSRTRDSAVAEEVSSGQQRPLSLADQLALRHCAGHAVPSLVRSERDVAEHVCFPLRLAQRASDRNGDLFPLARTPLLTAPAAQARAYVHQIACLLRSDLWDGDVDAVHGPSTRLLLLTALHRLWQHADVSALLRSGAAAFSTEELLVLTAAAAHMQEAVAKDKHCVDDGVVAAAPYCESSQAALQHLCSEAAEWRLAAAVDAWLLFTRLEEESGWCTLRFQHCETRVGALVCEMLARSGDTILQAMTQAEQFPTVSSGRVLPEVLRLLRVGEAHRWLSTGPAQDGGAAAVAASEGGSGDGHEVVAKALARERFEHRAAALHSRIASYLVNGACPAVPERRPQ